MDLLCALMFRKTYYSRLDIDTTFEKDLHWIEQTKTEFELKIFQSDVEGIEERLKQEANTLGFQLTVSETDEGSVGNRIFLFAGRKQ